MTQMRFLFNTTCGLVDFNKAFVNLDKSGDTFDSGALHQFNILHPL
jgi:hypothetical protein